MLGKIVKAITINMISTCLTTIFEEINFSRGKHVIYDLCCKTFTADIVKSMISPKIFTFCAIFSPKIVLKKYGDNVS